MAGMEFREHAKNEGTMGPRWGHDGAKMAPRRAKMGPRWAKMAPRWPQDGPRGAQDSPRWPLMAHGGFEMAPRGP